MNNLHQPTHEHVLDALHTTRFLIQRGWCKGKAQDGDKYCLIGALAEATTTDPNMNVPGYLVWRGALSAINAQVPFPYPNAVAYNDDTDQRTVLELIDKTIHYVRQLQAGQGS